MRAEFQRRPNRGGKPLRQPVCRRCLYVLGHRWDVVAHSYRSTPERPADHHLAQAVHRGTLVEAQCSPTEATASCTRGWCPCGQKARGCIQAAVWRIDCKCRIYLRKVLPGYITAHWRFPCTHALGRLPLVLHWMFRLGAAKNRHKKGRPSKNLHAMLGSAPTTTIRSGLA